MITKQQQKYIQSLHNKKYRSEYREFLVEGAKGITELIDSDFIVKHIYCSEELAASLDLKHNFTVCSEKILNQISTTQSNRDGVAVVVRKNNILPEIWLKKTLFLDGINDPGNLGTIIRLADWYGIKDIVCSPDTVEVYNPKVIRSTMGSFTRVSLSYAVLTEVLDTFPFPVFGADLTGENIHKFSFPENLGLVIGSESHGISAEILAKLTQQITIPRFGSAESLNAAMATGIILDNIMRTS